MMSCISQYSADPSDIKQPFQRSHLLGTQSFPRVIPSCAPWSFSSNDGLSRALTLESVFMKLRDLLLVPLLVLLVFGLLDHEDLFDWCLFVAFWDVVILVEILEMCKPELQVPSVYASRTISPNSRIFSPRTRKMPRLMSAKYLGTNSRSTVSWSTMLPVYHNN